MLIGNAGLNSIANQVSQQGYSVAHSISKEAGADLGGSNFGTGTKIGSSVFQQTNERIYQDGQRLTSKNMGDAQGTIEQFENKQAYTKNATLAALQQNIMDVSS